MRASANWCDEGGGLNRLVAFLNRAQNASLM